MAEPEPAEEPAEEPAAATEAPEAGPEAEPEMAAEKAAAELAPELEAEPEPLGDPNPVPAVNFAGDPTTAADLPTWLGTLGLPADHLRDFLPQLRDNGFETVASLVEPPITDADLKVKTLPKRTQTASASHRSTAPPLARAHRSRTWPIPRLTRRAPTLLWLPVASSSSLKACGCPRV